MFSKLFKVIVVLFLFMSTKAQDSSSNKHDEDPLHEPSMAGVLIVLLIMFILTFLIVAYAKFCNRPFSYYQSNGQQVQHEVLSRSRFSGIDRSVIESLPFFKFSSLKGSKDGLECVVCLSRFEEIEVLRLLPKCKHAFHMNCIDLWLENHSSCPICRHKFDVEELSRLSYTNSFRYPRNSGNLTDEPNLEIFVQREQDRIRSSRFNMLSTLQNIKTRSDEDDVLIKKGSMDNVALHKFKHRIIVSDVICKTRWSDVNTSDLMFLNSEMVNVISNKRFEKTGSSSGRLVNEISTKKEFVKMKDDMDLVEKTRTRLLDPGEKRSMSEITNVSRFEEFSTRRRISGLSSPVVKDEKVWRLWVPIVKRTIQLYAGRESSSENAKHQSNV